MQFDAQKFLPIAEKAGALAFVDIEAANLNADFGTMVVTSIKPYKQKPLTFWGKPGKDKKLVKTVAEVMAEYPLWCTFYGKLFDIPFINSRLLVNGLPPLPKHHHIDLYWTVKSRTHLSRRNQGHILSWLGTPEEKMSVGPGVWANLAANYGENIEILKERCESDVIGLEAMYEKVKHLISEITR
jgi:uncharacterized protein YprB with RNaseH-like and TPR domain